MAKAVKKKAAKKRASTYDPKLAINGTFEEVVAVSLGMPVPKKKVVKKK